MARTGRNGKRVLAKKVTSFNMYVDQANQIQAIMEATGAERDAQVLRELLDEALAGRRRKIAQQLALPEPVLAPPDYIQTQETTQTLLLRLIRQGEKARCVRGISLELLQEILAEAHAGRNTSWDVALRLLGDNWPNPEELRRLLDDRMQEGKNHAYKLAGEISKSQDVRGGPANSSPAE